MRLLLPCLSVLLALAQASYAEVDVKDLAVELDEGHISVEAATGNGGSSGNAVDAYVVSKRSVEVSVDITLNRPLFFRNRGRGQNMIATHVYLGSGQYQKSGRKSFITLKPSVRTRVSFVAYCVDFEKDNPSNTDTFAVDSPPSKLGGVMKTISAHAAAHPDDDITAAAQAAIWLAQGVSITDIRTKFDVSHAEEALARRLIQ